MKRKVKLPAKPRPRYRAVSPDGKAAPWRRLKWMAVRDAVFELKGWGPSGKAVTINVDSIVAYVFADEAVAAGWSFQRMRA